MKYRKGFVSNSSSSSYVIFVPKEAYDNAYPNFHPMTQELAKTHLSPKEVLGVKAMALEYHLCTEDYGDGLDEFYSFVAALEAIKGSYVHVESF